MCPRAVDTKLRKRCLQPCAVLTAGVAMVKALRPPAPLLLPEQCGAKSLRGPNLISRSRHTGTHVPLSLWEELCRGSVCCSRDQVPPNAHLHHAGRAACPASIPRKGDSWISSLFVCM